MCIVARIGVGFCSLLLMLSSAHFVVAKDHSVDLEFGQSAGESGGVRYSLRVTDVHSAPVDVIAPVFTTPNGTQLLNGQEVYRDTFAELASLAFGDWSAFEESGAVDVTFQFRVVAFDVNNVFNDLPYITSPSQRVVPENFEVHWKYKNGSTPSRSDLGAIQTENFSLLSSDFINKPGQGHFYGVAIKGQLTGSQPGSATVRVGTRTNLLTPRLFGPASVPDNFAFRSRFFSYVDTTFTVVPEPSTLLIALAGFGLFGIRRRQARGARHWVSRSRRLPSCAR